MSGHGRAPLVLHDGFNTSRYIVCILGGYLDRVWRTEFRRNDGDSSVYGWVYNLLHL